MNKDTRILVVCEQGLVRSTAFKTELVWHRKYENVLNVGIEAVLPDTFAMLAKWADIIYVTADRGVWREIPHTFRAKSKFVDFGKDVWMNPHDPRLMRLAKQKATQIGL